MMENMLRMTSNMSNVTYFLEVLYKEIFMKRKKNFNFTFQFCFSYDKPKKATLKKIQTMKSHIFHFGKVGVIKYTIVQIITHCVSEY